jgi:protein-disulfide isomerase
MSAAAAVLLAAASILVVSVVDHHAGARAVLERRTGPAVNALLAGIPQQGSELGRPNAPVTLEVYADLKDPDCRDWFGRRLPAIVRRYVRTGVLTIRFLSYKTNTFNPREFVNQQTAALAAGAQDKLWNFIATFYREQGSEFSDYVTEGYLDGLAKQVPGLNLARWRSERRTGRREEQVTEEDRAARALGLHVTPSFRIGRTGAAMKALTGHSIIKYGEQHPIALPTAEDLGQAIKRLGVDA